MQKEITESEYQPRSFSARYKIQDLRTIGLSHLLFALLQHLYDTSMEEVSSERLFGF